MKPCTKYVDLDAVKAQYKAACDDLHARLPEVGPDGKKVNKNDHKPHPELLDKLIARVVNAAGVADALVADLSEEIKAAVLKQ